MFVCGHENVFILIRLEIDGAIPGCRDPPWSAGPPCVLCPSITCVLLHTSCCADYCRSEEGVFFFIDQYAVLSGICIYVTDKMLLFLRITAPRALLEHDLDHFRTNDLQCGLIDMLNFHLD